MDTQKPHADGESATTMDRSEKSKVRILGVTTVAASLVAVGAVAWGLSNADGGAGTGGPGTGQFGPPGMPGQGGPAGTMSGQNGTGGLVPGGAPGAGITGGLLDADGSVNEQALAQLLAAIPGGDLQAFLRRQVDVGLLTEEQAEAVAAAAGDSTSGGGA